MSNKEEVVSVIKEWVNIDNEINKLQKRLKEMRKVKKDYNIQLINIMKSNEIDCFDINNEQILYTQKNTKTPLNKKNIISILTKYFNDSDKANTMCSFILDNREEKIIENIRRKINKNN